MRTALLIYSSPAMAVMIATPVISILHVLEKKNRGLESE
jgi:hypothetical protein